MNRYFKILPILLLLLVADTFAKAAPYQCLIKLNGTDCTNCMAGASEIARLSSSLPLVFVVQEVFQRDSALIFGYFRKRGMPDASVVWSDSLYSKLSPNHWSSVHVVDEQNQEVFQCPLKAFNRNLAVLNSYVRPSFQESRRFVFDGLRVSFDTHFLVTESQYAWLDYAQNEILVGELEDGRSHKIQMAQFDVVDIVERVLEEEGAYDLTAKNQALLERYNKPRVRFEQIHGRGDTLWTLNSVPYFTRETMKGQNAMALTFVLFIGEFVNGELNSVKPIRLTTHKKYDIDQSSPFFFRGDQLLLSIFQEEASGKRLQYSAYEWKGDHYAFQDFPEHRLPEYFKEKELGYSVNQSRIADGYLIYNHAPNVIEMASGKGTSFDFLNDQPSTEASDPDLQNRILGVKRLKNQLKIISGQGENLVVAIYDIPNSNLVSKITFPATSLPDYVGNIEMIDFNTIAFLSPENELKIGRFQ